MIGGKFKIAIRSLSYLAVTPYSLETGLICILLSASRDVHFDKKIDMLLKWSIVKSTSEPKPQRKAYYFKDTALLCDFWILFVRNPMISFYE